MRFDKLNEMIPYVTGGKKHFFTAQPYNAVSIAMPGRHQNETNPVGGDMVVIIDDEGMDWIKHRFTHSDIFADIENKRLYSPNVLDSLMDAYAEVVRGADPEKFLAEKPELFVGLHPHTFLYGVQLLAIAEHRRYAHYESKFGGKFLPLRFSAGISEGLWTAAQASEKQKYGRPAVEQLEKKYGVPTLTRGLMT